MSNTPLTDRTHPHERANRELADAHARMRNEWRRAPEGDDYPDAVGWAREQAPALYERYREALEAWRTVEDPLPAEQAFTDERAWVSTLSEEVQDWVARQTDPRRVEPLLEAPRAIVRHHAASACRHPDRAFCERALAHEPVMLTKLFHNEHLPEDVFAWLTERTAAWLESGEQRERQVAASTVLKLLRMGHRWDASVLATCVQRVRERAVALPGDLADLDPPLPRASLRAWLDDLAAGPLSAPAHEMSLVARALVAHPRAGPDDYRAVARTTGHSNVRHALVDCPEAMQDEAVRCALAESTDRVVLEKMLAYAQGDELRGLVARLFERDRLAALEAIERHVEDPSALEAATVRPLLDADDSDVRQRAILLMSRMDGADPAPEPPARRPG